MISNTDIPEISFGTRRRKKLNNNKKAKISLSEEGGGKGDHGSLNFKNGKAKKNILSSPVGDDRPCQQMKDF